MNTGASDFLKKPILKNALIESAEKWVFQSKNPCLHILSQVHSGISEQEKYPITLKENILGGSMEACSKSNYDSDKDGIDFCEVEDSAYDFQVASICRKVRIEADFIDDSASSDGSSSSYYDCKSIQNEQDLFDTDLCVSPMCNLEAKSANVEINPKFCSSLPSLRPSSTDFSLDLVTVIMFEHPEFTKLAVGDLLRMSGMDTYSLFTSNQDPISRIMKNHVNTDLIMLVLEAPEPERENNFITFLDALACIPKEEKPILLGLLSEDMSFEWRQRFMMAGFEKMNRECLKVANFKRFIWSFFRY